MVYNNLYVLSEKLINDLVFEHGIIKLRSKYKNDNLSDESLKNEFLKLLKELKIDNDIVGITKRPFGINIKVNNNVINVHVKVTGNSGQLFSKLKS